MERRYQVRLRELLDEAVVEPELTHGALARLERFVEPFAACLTRAKQRSLAQQYVAGLFSQVKRRNIESIAYLHDQDRQPLQKFIGQYSWDHRLLIAELARQVGAKLGDPRGVLVFDPSGFPKKGTESVGVQRQWCGRLGKIDNCQVGTYLAYVGREGHALVDQRLYLPEQWARSKSRRAKCGVPPEIKFCTRHELALQMLDEHAAVLPHAWVAGDDEMGKVPAFRGELHARGEHYVLAVPSNTVVRELSAEPAPCAARGRPRPASWLRVDRWSEALAREAWKVVEVRDGEKGPLVVEAAKVRVQAKSAPTDGLQETLLVMRERQADGTLKHDYFLSNGSPDTPLAELVRVAKAEHCVEDCLERAKGEAGLAEYQVRTWQGWHHHQTLSLVATWFLTLETRRGKKIHPGAHHAAGPSALRVAVA